MFICSMVLHSWHIKNQLESEPVTADLTTTVVHSYKLLIKDFKPVQRADTHSSTPL